jgi:CubicO group peptidase (beta-lactamase class C family)
MKMNRAIYSIAVCCCVILSLIFVQAQTRKETTVAKKEVAAPATPPPATTGKPELTATDLEAYLDGMMPAQLERENIAGAVIAVVKDGQVLFAKGYGYSNVEKRTPVTADKTLFRPGSISKLFTWTSVMQQVEQGKLDLDKDVNEYLDFKIPPAFGKPITLRNIMTHTPGFEETVRDLFVADAQHLTPVGQYLQNHLPQRIYPPGVVPAYSNYATTLAGYIVQRVSGKPFEHYVADNIFNPLGMQSTTFVQPLPPNLAPMMSEGYRKASDKAKDFEFVEAFPAGSVSTSARDMCNFMIAHLQDGKFGSAQILQPETAKQMHSRTYGADDRLNGMALGFYEESRNGHRIIGHGGDTEYFHSDLHLILDSNVGFFVSYNSAGNGEVSGRTILFNGFLDRYFPYTPPPGEKVADAKADAAEISGIYHTSRRAESSWVKLLDLAGELKVVTNSDGTISVDMLKAPSGVPIKFTEINPFLFRKVNGQDQIAFKKDSDGAWQFQIDFPVFIFQRAPALANKYFNYFLLIFGLGVVILTLLLWPIAAIIRKHYGRPLALTDQESRARLIVRLICILFVVLLGGWALAISKADDIASLNTLAPWVVILGIVGILCALGTIYAILNAFRSLQAPGRWAWAKLGDVAIALACLCLVWFAFYWNLLSFNTRY